MLIFKKTIYRIFAEMLYKDFYRRDIANRPYNVMNIILFYPLVFDVVERLGGLEACRDINQSVYNEIVKDREWVMENKDFFTRPRKWTIKNKKIGKV